MKTTLNTIAVMVLADGGTYGVELERLIKRTVTVTQTTSLKAFDAIAKMEQQGLIVRKYQPLRFILSDYATEPIQSKSQEA